jgi:hypothetical protein
MTSSVWVDLAATLAAKDGNVFDDGGTEIPVREVLRMLDELPADGPNNAAFRWVVAVGEDNQMKLQLQSLPGSAVLVAGKPTLRQKVFSDPHFFQHFLSPFPKGMRSPKSESRLQQYTTALISYVLDNIVRRR